MRTFRPKSKLEAFYTGGPIRLSPDARTFACACLQDTHIVDSEDGTVLKTFPGDGELVTAICYGHDGRYLYSASRSLIVKMWSTESGECLRTVKGHSAPISDICIEASGSIVAFGSADRSVSVYDIKGGFRTHTFRGHTLTVLRVLFHPIEGELVSCGTDGAIKVWDLHRSKLKATLKGHSSAVTSIVYSEDGRYLISAGRDNVIMIWLARTYIKCAEFPVFEAIEDVVCLSSDFTERLFLGQRKKSRHPCLILACGWTSAFATSTVRLFSGGERGSIRMWRSDTGTDIFHPATDVTSQEITSMQPIPNKHSLMITKSDCSIEFLDYESVEREGRIQLVSSRLLLGNMDEITDLAFLDANAHQMAVASNAPHIHILETKNLNCSKILIGHTDAVLCIAVASFQLRPLLLSGSKDQSIRIWDADYGGCLADGTGHAAAVTAVAISNKNAKLVVTVSSDKLVKVWKLKMQLKDNMLSVEKLKVISGIVGHSKDINCVDIAPNDAMAATGSLDKNIKIFNLPHLTLQSTLTGHKRGIWSVEFSKKEKTVLSSSADMTIKIWSLTDNSCLRTFEGHSGSILKAVFLDQSHQVISCGGDGLVKLWNVSTCECINTFDEHEDRIWTLTFAGEHQDIMASGGSDSKIIIWMDTTEEDKSTAIREKQEALTKQQDLSNAIHARHFNKAAKLAFELEHPRALLQLLKTRLPKSDHVHVFSAIINQLVDDPSLKTCLEYVRDWNTNAKHCEEAQTLLKMILEHIPPQKLASIPGVSTLLEAIETYSLRHFHRLQKLHQATYVVDYVLEAMEVLTPAPESSDEGNEMEELSDKDELMEMDDV